MTPDIAAPAAGGAARPDSSSPQAPHVDLRDVEKQQPSTSTDDANQDQAGNEEERGGIDMMPVMGLQETPCQNNDDDSEAKFEHKSNHRQGGDQTNMLSEPRKRSGSAANSEKWALDGPTATAPTSSDGGVAKAAQPSRQPSFDDLFFDLLFVAALAVYSSNANLSSAGKIATYIGYFSLLWWSWWTQTRFDVRYRGRDNLGFIVQCIQRIVRCALLGVWVAFATVTSEFARDGHANFTMIYVGSRAALIVDYLIIIAHSLRAPISPRDEHIPGAIERRHKQKNRRILSSHISAHIITVLGTLTSAMMWLGSRYVPDDGKTLPPSVIGIWLAGIAIELATEVFVELCCPQRALSATPIVERLALFLLIVFGNGFENLGTVLNMISPGNHDGGAVSGRRVGGWGSMTVLNAAASVLIVVLLYFGYFSRAIKHFDVHPGRLLVWVYAHLFLHVSAAVLMIGLAKVIGFVNTLNAFIRFGENPQLYLPQTPDWHAYLTDGGFERLLNDDTPLPALNDIADYYDRTVVSILSTTASLQGAIIPDLQLSAALVNSTVPFYHLSVPHAVWTVFEKYKGLLENSESPDGLSEYTRQNLYSFYFAYLCPAIFMFADVFLKVLQNSANGFRAMERKLMASLAIRTFFGISLVIIQVAYLTQLDKFSDESPIVDCLIILACILLLECIVQFSITAFGPLRYSARSLLASIRHGRKSM